MYRGNNAIPYHLRIPKQTQIQLACLSSGLSSLDRVPHKYSTLLLVLELVWHRTLPYRDILCCTILQTQQHALSWSKLIELSNLQKHHMSNV